MDVDEPAAKRKKISGFPVCSSHALGPFYLRNQLGSGSTCLVFHAKSTKSLAPLTPRDSVGPRYVAVKVVPIGQADEVKKKKILREVRIHETLRHPHVLEMITGEEREEKGAWPKGLYIVLQLATGGDLFDKIPPEVGLPDRMAHLYFTQMVSGLKYLASQGIVHRDIKPENILLDQFGNLKITDFGLATVFKYKGQTRLLTDRCGSAPYAAPELAGNAPYSGEPIDIWSAGIVLFTLLVGNTPWDEPTVASPDFAAYVSSEIWSYDPWDRINDKQRSVLLGVLTIDPKHRLRLPDIEQTEWFRIVNPLIDDATGLVQNPMMVGRMLSEHLRRHELIGEPTSAFDEMCQEMDAVNLEEQNGAPPPLSQATQRMLENKGCNPGAGFAASMQMATRLSAAPSQRLNPNTKRFFTTVAPMQIVEYLVNALTQLLVPHEVLQDAQETPAGIPFIVRVRFEHIDTRKQPLVGSIAISEGHLEADDVTGQSAVDGYDVVAHRKEGNPLELTKFWQDVKRLLPPGVVQVM